MGEYAAKFRPEVDLDEFERRLRAAAPAPQPRAEAGDPLAELARLVGGASAGRKEDPFEALFRAQSAIGDIRHPHEVEAPQPEPGAPAAEADRFAHYSLREPYFEEQPQAPAEAAQAEGYAPGRPPYQESEPGWAPEDHGGAEAQQGWPAAFDEVHAAPPPPVFRRKVMYGMGALLALGVIGIAGTLAMRGKSSSGDVVTIQADSDPARVKPAQGDGSAAPAGEALFDRKSNGNVSKVVSGVEQPADLGATVKNARVVGSAADVAAPAAPAPSAAAPAPNGAASDSVFPAPRKVKTVSVRADGTVIDGGEARPAARALPSMAAGTPLAPVAPSAKAPAAKSTERAGSSNEAALRDRAQAAAKPAAAKPAAKEVAAKENAAKENAAKESPAKEAAGEGGGYAVQLAGTPSESEARAAASRLAEKYSSALGGHRPTFVQAKVGDKTLYRVRVGRLTEEKAKSMCAAVKAQGGNCFVAKN